MQMFMKDGVQYVPGEYVEYTAATNYWFGFMVGVAVTVASVLLIMIIANAVVEIKTRNKKK